MAPTPRPRRHVITGAAGALGRAVARRVVESGGEAIGIARRPLAIPGCAEVVGADIRSLDFAPILRSGDIVLHLAAFVHRTPRTDADIQEIHDVNVSATERLAEACLGQGATLVLASTVAVWSAPPVSPDSAPNPATEYGKSKLLAEQRIRALGESGLAFSIVRLPLLYGPNGHGNMERLLQAIQARRYWPIGDPATPKSCLFFEDAASALLLAAERGLGETFVAAPEVPSTLGEIHSAAYAAVGRQLPSICIPRGAALSAARVLRAALGLVGRSTPLPEQVETLTSPARFDGTSFALATGFAAEVTLEQGMQRTVRWLLDATA